MANADASGYSVAGLADLERVPLSDPGVDWIPIRDSFGIRAFGVNAWTAEAGAEVIGPHEETDDFAGGHQELYFVASGRATFRIGDCELDAPAGTLVFVADPTLTRGAVARELDTTILTIGGSPGTPFEVAPWEWLVRAGAHSRAGDLDGAVQTIQRGLDECPGSAELLYHLACYEGLAGLEPEAVRDLRAAIERDARNLDRARRDPDLQQLRSSGQLAGLLA